MWGDGELGLPSESRRSSKCKISSDEWFSKRIQFNAAGVGDLVWKRGNSDGDVVGSRKVPASTKNSAAGVPGRTAVVVHGDERGINGSGFGDVKRRLRVVTDGDDLIDREGVAVKGVVDVGGDS